MVDQDLIQQAVQILAEKAHPLRIILFGSHARGEAREDSDVDILVIQREVKNRRQETTRLRQAIASLDMAVDIIVVSEDYFEKWSQAPSTAMYWAKQEGRVLYNAA